MTFILREDLEPWNCQGCDAVVRKGQFLNGMFYCNGCAPSIEMGLEALAEDYTAVEVPEVKLEEK